MHTFAIFVTTVISFVTTTLASPPPAGFNCLSIYDTTNVSCSSAGKGCLPSVTGYKCTKLINTSFGPTSTVYHGGRVIAETTDTATTIQGDIKTSITTTTVEMSPSGTAPNNAVVKIIRGKVNKIPAKIIKIKKVVPKVSTKK